MFKDKEVKDYPTNLDYFSECKVRVGLAKKIDQLEHQMGKEKNTTNWFTKHAKMLDIELDDQTVKENSVDIDQNSKSKRQLQQLKGQLDAHLKKMIYPKFTSRNYLQVGTVNKVQNINSNFIL